MHGDGWAYNNWGMPNVASVLNEQIRKLARREVRGQTKNTKKLTAHYRRDIAALKREVAKLRKSIAFLERQERRRVSGGHAGAGASTAAGTGANQEAAAADGMRFRMDGLKSHRARLGISAKDYGRLVGVSGLTIYHWEGGKAKPRRAQLAKLAGIRGMGKREAMKRLELLSER